MTVDQEDADQGPTAQEDRTRSCYARFFTDEELDVLEKTLEETVRTDTEVTPESEEYDKELKIDCTRWTRLS